jgi:hypothetical protein
MSKFLFLLLIIGIFSKPNFLSFLEDNSQKLDLNEIPSSIYANSLNWIGFSLSSSHVITKISWSFENEEVQMEQFGIFEGSNDPEFKDSVPLYMFKKTTSDNSVDIKSTSSFKYVRFVSPNKRNVTISDVEIFGYKPETDDENEGTLYQPTNIPLIVVNTEGNMNFRKKTTQTNCTIIIVEDGKMAVKQTGTIRIRGNSSKDLEKKSFQIHFDKKTNVLGMPAKAKKWGLLANHMDKSLIRNLVAFKISSLLGQKYSPACKSVDLIIDGSFEGNYIICDKIEQGKNRVELDKMDETDNELPNISGGYLMEIDGFADQEPYHFTSKKGVKVTIKYPDATKNQTAYLKGWFDELEENIYTNQQVDNIDLDTFSQYFILNEFCADIDSVWSSYYVTKQRNDDKLHFGPAWDFDLSLDNDNRLYPTNSKGKWIFNFGLSSGTYRQFISKLMGIEKTLTTVQKKWTDVTNNEFTKENVFNFIDEQIKYIDESQKLNFERWDVLNKILKYEAVARGSYEEEIKHLKEYIEERFVVFGNMLLNANTSSFEVSNNGGWNGGGWNPGDWNPGDWNPGDWNPGDWDFPSDWNFPSDMPWNNPDNSDWPWTNPGEGGDWPWGGDGNWPNWNGEGNDWNNNGDDNN